jgi:hypothetical protein
MPQDLREVVKFAQMDSPLDGVNDALYKLCEKYPQHTSIESVIAKVWLIGRAYSATIERRRNKSDENDDFYVKKVGPSIKDSKIDSWIKTCPTERPSKESLPTMLEVHNLVTQLFCDINGQRLRSLASKYLHFHVPAFFFIYDTRVCEGMASPELQHIVKHVGTGKAPPDEDYRKFATKCLALQEYIEDVIGEQLTPRQIDNFLLRIHANQKLETAAKRNK